MIDYNQYREYIYLREVPVIFDRKELFVFFPTKKAMTTTLTRYLLKDRAIVKKDNKKLWNEYFKKTDFNKIYKFGIIREPISRFISAFHYIKYTQHIYKYLKIPKNMNQKMKINNYIKKILVNYENPFDINSHFGFQYSGYFFNDNKLVDDIFILENMNKDYIKLFKKIKLDKEILKENKTEKKEKLDEESIKILNNIYCKDIKFYQKCKNDYKTKVYKNVAICMRGAISKIQKGGFLLPGELYKEGKYVDFHKCYDSIIKFIVKNNCNYNFDFFCHSWNNDLKKELNDLYNPKELLCENNNNYEEQILKKCEKDSQFSQVSQALSIKKSIELKEKYEKSNQINYDIVISYRYDVLLWKYINLDNYILNNNIIYVNAHKNCNGDFHFIMNNNVSYDFKNIYNFIGDIEPLMHNHIKEIILNKLKKNLLMDNIKPGEKNNQAVIRKIDKDILINEILPLLNN